MNNDFRLGTLEQLIDFRNGKAIKKTDGGIPIYGGNGVLGYSDKSNYENTLIIGRVGAYCGSVHIKKDKCWVAPADERPGDGGIDHDSTQTTPTTQEN